ncbi:IclR family transcriptional regulator [Mycobacterium sp. TNTM28]|uniref:IclR family transcriptional regulator n=1 Tax=[Mycobacterium] fortunisiensis TaxID=2600579 RepID=A0ABS6KTF1_9MYCO|nr:IclR family transcriptional regulator [[Mycobacterium] fortunisiensis]MBU9766835.1 IclR family transcriptional regulator [[Mycobacterium] fortunisiensis]
MTEVGPGTPVITRAAAILRALADARSDGITTTVLARTTGMPRATAHRMLTALADEGLVDRASDTGLWFLGPEVYLLGSVAAARYDAAPLASDILRELARDTGESAFLSARRGDESVCVAAEEGSFPLRSHVLYPGKRFPLGVASAGIVMLAHLPDAEVTAYLEHVDLTADWGDTHSSAQLRRRVEQTRIKGYSVNPGLVVEGSWGIGAAVFNELGRPMWALSLTGVEIRFGAQRQAALGETLLLAAHTLGQRLKRKR